MADDGIPTARPDGHDDTHDDTPRIVVMTPDGMASAPVETGGEGPDGGPANPAEMVGEPAKVMRIGTMIKQLLEEVRGAPLDDAARSRLAEIHARSVRELTEGLSPELAAELERITLPFSDASTPTDAELRVAQAQLVGWLEGLFHGIQTALVAQQMAAQAQLSQMRRALPGAPAPMGPGVPGAMGGPQPGDERAPGQYL